MPRVIGVMASANRANPATGNKIGSKFLVNTYTASNQLFPTVTGLTNGGGFVVTPPSTM